MASKISINLDTSKENYLVSKCKQNDDLVLEAFIYDKGLELDLNNKEITIQALKADNTYIIQNTDIVKENNKITANLVKDFTRVPGETKIEIVLVASSKQNTTFSFTLEVIGSVIRRAVQSSNTATILEDLDNKIIEARQVKQETEELVQSGGAATKGDIEKINSSLEQIATININQFPRLAIETDDAPRFQRAFDYLYGKKGVLKINGERYYFKSKNSDSDCFVKTYPNIDLIGEGEKSVIYLDNNSSNGVSGIFKSLNMHDSKYIGFVVDTSLIDLADDSDFYDLFYFRYDSTNTTKFNVKIKNVYTYGKAYQSAFNIGVLNENNVTNFASGLLIEDCIIQQQGYATCLNDITYKNVTWFVDLDALRPNYLNNGTQTPVKFSGKASFVNNQNLIDCKMIVTGNRLSFNPIEVFRTSNAIIDNLEIITSKNGYIVATSGAGGKVAQYGSTDKETKLLIRNCSFSGISILAGELGVVTIDNCEFEKCNNTFYGNYVEANKETIGIGYSRIIVKNSYVKDTCSRIAMNSNGSNKIVLENCTIDYDRSKSPNGGFGTTSIGELTLSGTKIYINGTGGSYLLSSSGSNNIEFLNVAIFNGTYTGDSTTMLYLSGSHREIKFVNTYNAVRRSGTNFLDKATATISKEIVFNAQ